MVKKTKKKSKKALLEDDELIHSIDKCLRNWSRLRSFQLLLKMRKRVYINKIYRVQFIHYTACSYAGQTFLLIVF